MFLINGICELELLLLPVDILFKSTNNSIRQGFKYIIISVQEAVHSDWYPMGYQIWGWVDFFLCYYLTRANRTVFFHKYCPSSVDNIFYLLAMTNDNGTKSKKDRYPFFVFQLEYVISKIYRESNQLEPLLFSIFEKKPQLLDPYQKQTPWF